MTIPAPDGTRIAYRIDGPQEPAAKPDAIVFVNSLGTNVRMWEPQSARLCRRLRVVRYDQRGHGESEAPPGPYSMELLGQDLLALLDGLGLRRVHLCGLSLGGMVALWFAAHFPERVDRAVFADTAARIGTTDGWNDRISAVESGGMASVRETVVARFLSTEFRARRPDVAREVGDMVEATDPRGYAGACAALRDADLHPLLGEVRAPSLVMAGERDESTPVEQARELHEALRGSRLEIVSGAAHLSNLEKSDFFNQRVTEFLDLG